MAELNFLNLLPIIQGGGYFLIFITMLIEGPIITVAAGFLASQGFFNVYAVIVLSFLGGFFPDLFFYYLGRVGRNHFVDKYGKYIGLRRSLIKKAGTYFKNHSKKAIVVLKLMPFMGVPGVFSAGVARVHFKKFLITDFLFNLIGAVIFTLLGFYFGLGFERIAPYLGWFFSIIAVVIILFAFLPIIFKRIFRKVSGNIEKSLNR